MTEGIRDGSFLVYEPTPVPGAVEYTVRGKGDYGKFRCEEGARARKKVAEAARQSRSRSASPERGRSKTKFQTTRRFRQLQANSEPETSTKFFDEHAPVQTGDLAPTSRGSQLPKKVEISKCEKNARKEERAKALKSISLTMMGVSAVALFTIGMLASNFFTRIPILGRFGGSIAAGSTAALLLGGTAFVYSHKLQLEADRDHKQYLEEETAKLEARQSKVKRFGWEHEHLDADGKLKDLVIQTGTKRSSS